MGWIYLEHPETGGTTRIPDDAPGVLAAQEARGWREVPEPDQTPAVPQPSDQAVDPNGWVELLHPETGGVQRIPNNSAALAGAYAAGWQLPAAGEATEDQPDPEPAERIKRASGKPADHDKEG